MDPQGKFWTDSNGLEMQKREIQFFESNMSSQNNQTGYNPNYKTISNNFYPVDSAIVMRDLSKDSNVQVTLLNERPQSGSADMTDKATIEIIQNRRLLCDDDFGIEEALNETDSDGIGLQSTALYYLHMFEMDRGVSFQRQQQLKIQKRPEYFFAFNFDIDPQLAQGNETFGPTKGTFDILQTNFTELSSTFRLFPVNKNQVLVRFENLADHFDTRENQTKQNPGSYQINVEKFGKDLYESVNRVQPKSFKIVEMDVQGVHPKTAKFMWRGAGMPQASVEGQKTNQIEDFKNIQLYTQSFKTFQITYNQEEKKQKLIQSKQMIGPKINKMMHLK